MFLRAPLWLLAGASAVQFAFTVVFLFVFACRRRGILSAGNVQRDVRGGRDHHGDVSAIRSDAERGSLHQTELRSRGLRGRCHGVRGGPVFGASPVPVSRGSAARRSRTLSARRHVLPGCYLQLRQRSDRTPPLPIAEHFKFLHVN